MNNKYVNRSKISEAKFREVVRLFALDLTAVQIAELSGLNRNTVNRYLNGIRQRLAQYCNVTAPIIYPKHDNSEQNDTVELIFLWERSTKIYTHLIREKQVDPADYSTKKMAIDNAPDSFINLSQKEQGYLFETASNKKKQNRLRGYWGFIKSRLSKLKGIHDSTLCYHLKECEFRHNHNKNKLYSLILKIIRNHPLF